MTYESRLTSLDRATLRSSQAVSCIWSAGLRERLQTRSAGVDGVWIAVHDDEASTGFDATEASVPEPAKKSRHRPPASKVMRRPSGG